MVRAAAWHGGKQRQHAGSAGWRRHTRQRRAARRPAGRPAPPTPAPPPTHLQALAAAALLLVLLLLLFRVLVHCSLARRQRHSSTQVWAGQRCGAAAPARLAHSLAAARAAALHDHRLGGRDLCRGRGQGRAGQGRAGACAGVAQQGLVRVQLLTELCGQPRHVAFCSESSSAPAHSPSSEAGTACEPRRAAARVTRGSPSPLRCEAPAERARRGPAPACSRCCCCCCCEGGSSSSSSSGPAGGGEAPVPSSTTTCLQVLPGSRKQAGRQAGGGNEFWISLTRAAVDCTQRQAPSSAAGVRACARRRWARRLAAPAPAASPPAAPHPGAPRCRCEEEICSVWWSSIRLLAERERRTGRGTGGRAGEAEGQPTLWLAQAPARGSHHAAAHACPHLRGISSSPSPAPASASSSASSSAAWRARRPRRPRRTTATRFTTSRTSRTWWISTCRWVTVGKCAGASKEQAGSGCLSADTHA